ncbi:MAG: TetR/AcrR family transcriptional regulator [Mycobacterium sp.]|uniref:TetR/AcrR family transcriptional regulator n=1 Tax=Mycobacterium sp. TaxID=1785 RepID=UPI001EB9F5AE|nr:TetR/AcrR family transcriptional regulator [Mycobacterium sp.]MBW0017399.1 TetR/AcrR family transcriptional regulator [Mycobacterium sp.]
MRIRLTTEQRRAQLLEIGAQVFARHPYEQVSIEEVAALAGVSRGLLYRYFPSKRAFFAAVVELEGDNLLRASSPDPALSPLDQIKAGLDVYIDQAENSPTGYRMAHHAESTEDDLGPTRQARTTIQRDRILNSLAAVIPIDSETRFAVTSWLGFVQTAILDWIDNPTISRQQLRDLCIRTLWAAVRLPAG